MQKSLDNISTWVTANQLRIATAKSNVLQIYSTGDGASYSMDHTILPLVGHCRDLGTAMDCKLKFDLHIYKIVCTAMQRAHLIFRCFQNKSNLFLIKAFKVFVRPILETASQVWSPFLVYLIDKIESVQAYFTSRLSGVGGLAYDQRLVFCGLERLEVRRIQADVIYCYKLFNDLVCYSKTGYLFLSPPSSRRYNANKLYIMCCKTDVMKYSYFWRVVKYWNFLGEEITSIPNIVKFQKAVRAFNFSSFIKGRR